MRFAIWVVLLLLLVGCRPQGLQEEPIEEEPNDIRAEYKEDLLLLARLIHAESRGEPFDGQVAVGAVVLNRVESEHFPDTIPGVIYQPQAFSVVRDGQIRLEPSETSLRAARDAIHGIDPSNGALYFYNPARARSRWLFSRPTIKTIGKHVFAR